MKTLFQPPPKHRGIDDSSADSGMPPLEGKLRLTNSRPADLKWFAWSAAVAVWLQALYIAGTTTYWTLRSLHPIPFWDAWETVKFLELNRPVTLSWLWSQHNEHRILIPRLADYADYRFFGGCGYFDLSLIWLMQIGSALIIASLSFDVIGRASARRPWRVLACGLVVCLAFSSAQMENFYWQFQTNFVGLLFFSILAFFCVKQSTESRHSLVWIAGGALAAIASALCLASGIITTFIFTAGCWMARVRRRTLFLITLLFVAFTAAYLHGYTTSGSLGSPFTPLLNQRLLLLEYVFVFMGNAMAGEIGWIPGRIRHAIIRPAIIGSCGLALFALAIWLTAFRQGRDKTCTGTASGALVDEKRLAHRIPPASLALFSVASLVIGQGFITALDRHQNGLGQALSSRYVTPVAFFWIAVLVLTLALVLDERPLSTRFLGASCALIFVTIGLLTVQERSVGEDFARRVAGLELAANELRVGVVDLSAFGVVYPWPDAVAAARPFLIKNRLSIFSDSRYTWLGRRISEVASPSPPDSCFGLFDSAFSVGVQGGAKVEGWAWSRREKKPPRQILLVDDAGIIVGLASSGIERPDVAKGPEITDLRTGWQGYAKAGRNVSAYAVIEAGREVCKLIGSFNIVPGASHIGDVASPSPPGSCLGYVDGGSSDGGEGGAKVNGWAWSRRDKSAPNQILLVDDAGIIVGLASSGIERPDVVAAIPEIKDTATGWQGYAKAGRNVSAYAVIEGGREVCKLIGSFNIVPGAP